MGKIFIKKSNKGKKIVDTFELDHSPNPADDIICVTCNCKNEEKDYFFCEESVSPKNIDYNDEIITPDSNNFYNEDIITPEDIITSNNNTKEVKVEEEEEKEDDEAEEVFDNIEGIIETAESTKICTGCIDINAKLDQIITLISTLNTKIDIKTNDNHHKVKKIENHIEKLQTVMHRRK